MTPGVTSASNTPCVTPVRLLRNRLSGPEGRYSANSCPGVARPAGPPRAPAAGRAGAGDRAVGAVSRGRTPGDASSSCGFVRVHEGRGRAADGGRTKAGADPYAGTARHHAPPNTPAVRRRAPAPLRPQHRASERRPRGGADTHRAASRAAARSLRPGSGERDSARLWRSRGGQGQVRWAAPETPGAPAYGSWRKGGSTYGRVGGELVVGTSPPSSPLPAPRSRRRRVLVTRPLSAARSRPRSRCRGKPARAVPGRDVRGPGGAARLPDRSRHPRG